MSKSGRSVSGRWAKCEQEREKREQAVGRTAPEGGKGASAEGWGKRKRRGLEQVRKHCEASTRDTEMEMQREMRVCQAREGVSFQAGGFFGVRTKGYSHISDEPVTGVRA